MKIIVSAGGSAGHINPALAIIHKFQEYEKDLEVLYIGTHNRMEKDMVPKESIPYESIEIYGFTKDIKRDIKNISCIMKSSKKCIEIMKHFQPDVVIGVGGYVTYPVLKAAHKLHIKTFIHEQNSIPGKSNKMIAKYADLIGVTFKCSMKHFKTKGQVIYTGHPSASEALKVEKLDKTVLGLSKMKKLVLIVAGSLGSASLNLKMKEYLHSIKNENYEVLYVTGKSHYDSFIKEETFPENVKVVPYIDSLTGMMKNADVVVSRSGAATTFELAALNIPSILIPSPNVANNHQYYNAKELVETGSFVMLEENDLSKNKLSQEIKDLLENKTKRFEMMNEMKKLKIMDSAELIYGAIKDMIK